MTQKKKNRKAISKPYFKTNQTKMHASNSYINALIYLQLYKIINSMI